jgi:hypothetical protein
LWPLDVSTLVWLKSLQIMITRFQFRYILFLLSLFLMTLTSAAQDIELKYTEFKDNKLVVHYVLKDSIESRVYVIRAYVSRDNFLNPLEKVTGDVGMEVKPGADNKIIWDVGEELGAGFEGKVSLEIRGRIFIPFINTESINQYQVFKRKRKYHITWTGGTPQNILNFDLYKGDKKIISYPNLANVGTYNLEFPSYIKPGKGYRFRISDSKNKEDVVYTNTFKIKRKVPLLLKAVPAAIVGVGLYALLKPKNGEPDLPEPILPE